MSILFSLAAGRNTECTIKRCLNVFKYNPKSILIINCDILINKDKLKDALSNFSNCFINPIPRSQNLDANLLESHCTNYIFARDSKLDFDIICLLSDQDMFIRYGLYEVIKYYDAGFMVCSNYLKPSNWKEMGFAERDFWNQKTEPFWTDSFLNDTRINRVISEQIEGSFYKRALFEEMHKYLENLPIHYTKILCSHYEETTFGTLYMNIFKYSYPIYLPISIIYRSDSIVQRPEHLFNILTQQKERESMVFKDSYETFHMFTFGIKRVKYHEAWDNIVNSIIIRAKDYLTEVDINNDNI
jgi:hypothetical protein